MSSKLAIDAAIAANVAIAATKLVVAGIAGSSAMLSEGIHSSVFEGLSFVIALRQLRRLAGGTPFWEFAHHSKDATTDTVLAEDSAALVGLAIAAVGIALSHWLQMPALDGAASVLFGILLAGVAALLAWQSRGLLIGEGIRPETARALRDIALAQPGVRDVGRVLSMYMGPDDALVTMDLDFDAGTETADAARAMAAQRTPPAADGGAPRCAR